MTRESIFTRKPKTSLFVVTLIMSLFVIVLLEVILRFTPYKIYVAIDQGAFPPMFIADDKAGFDLATNYKGGIHSTIETDYPVHTNNIACFDADVKLGERYNVLVGDSFTWGFSPLDKKWTTIVEHNTGQRFVKCGLPAYGPKQALYKLKKVVNKIGKAPKTIIYAYYWNDLNDDYTGLASTAIEGNLVNRIKTFNYETGELEYYSNQELKDNYRQYIENGSADYQSFGTFKKFKYWFKSNSIIANLVYNYFNSFRSHPVETIVSGTTAQYKTYLAKMSVEANPWLENAWKEHLNNLDEMINYAKSVDSKFMIVIIPTDDLVYPDKITESAKVNLHLSEKRLKQFLENKNVMYYDLFDDFAKAAKDSKDLYLSNDLHFSTKGEALAGKLISNYLQKNKFLELSQ